MLLLIVPKPFLTGFAGTWFSSNRFDLRMGERGTRASASIWASGPLPSFWRCLCGSARKSSNLKAAWGVVLLIYHPLMMYSGSLLKLRKNRVELSYEVLYPPRQHVSCPAASLGILFQPVSLLNFLLSTIKPTVWCLRRG